VPVGEAISDRSTSKSKQELVSITLDLHSLLTASPHAHLCVHGCMHEANAPGTQ